MENNSWRIVNKGKNYRMRDGALTDEQLKEQGFTIVYKDLTRSLAFEKYTEILRSGGLFKEVNKPVQEEKVVKQLVVRKRKTKSKKSKEE